MFIIIVLFHGQILEQDAAGPFPSIVAEKPAFMISIVKVYAPKQHNFLQDFVLFNLNFAVYGIRCQYFPIL